MTGAMATRRGSAAPNRFPSVVSSDSMGAARDARLQAFREAVVATIRRDLAAEEGRASMADTTCGMSSPETNAVP